MHHQNYTKVRNLSKIMSSTYEYKRTLFYSKDEIKTIILKFLNEFNKFKLSDRYSSLYFKFRGNLEFYSEILYHTKFLNIKENVTWKERVYCILNDIEEFPKCKYCGNNKNITFVSIEWGYRDYCSVKCSSNSKEKKTKIEETNLEKYGFKNAWGHVKSYSNISQELFNSIYLLLDDKIKKYTYYGSLNKEYVLYRDIENNRNIRPDFAIVSPEKQLIIEFYGDLWHANPKDFKEDDHPNYSKSNLTSKDIWERDKNRIDIMEKEGFKVKIVWEKDYHKDKNKVINECIKFINE